MYFASHLANTVSYKPVKLYLVAVQDLHRELKFPLKLTDMHRLQKVLTSIKRLTPPKQLDRFPITLSVLHSIHSYLKPEFFYNLDYVMLWAAFSLAFFGFLRSSEFTCNGPFDPSVHLTSTDITVVPNSHSPSHLLVRIKQSKTDPFRQGLNPDNGLHETISHQSSGQFFNTVVSLPTISTPTVSVLQRPQQQPELAFHPGSLKF